MKHRVQINDDNRLYGLDRDLFEEGERVEFCVMFATDTDYAVGSDQADVKLDRVEDGYKGIYCFTMPDEDVKVTVSSRNSMTFDPDAADRKRLHKQGSFKNRNGVFCPDCGAEVTEDLKFCPNCGHKLK